MKELTREAYAKINLTLDVLGKLPSGYHEVKMVMQSIDLHDDVTVRMDGTGKTTLRCSVPYLPTDASNLAWKAADAFYAAAGMDNPGTAIEIEKRIPAAAGLAGGSTDAAAVLRALNELHGTGFDDGKLCETALPLGADVPYCLLGGTMLAEGIGEKLTPLPGCPRGWVVLVKPPFSISTADAYAAMDENEPLVRPDTGGMLRALEVGDLRGVCHRLHNVMEEVAAEKHPELSEIRGKLLDCGAEGAVMSGSGPTVYGLFLGETPARLALRVMQKEYSEIYLSKIL